MRREEMKSTIKQILLEVRKGETNVEDASEAVVKVFEKSLGESIGEAFKMFPKGLFAGLSKGEKK